MRFACWITKATDTYSEYVTLVAFPRQQWLRQRATRLRHTYTAPLVDALITHSCKRNCRCKIYKPFPTIIRQQSVYLLHTVLVPQKAIQIAHAVGYVNCMGVTFYIQRHSTLTYQVRTQTACLSLGIFHYS
jgi:hypothetical protein